MKGEDEEIETTKDGGRHSRILEKVSLFPVMVLLAVLRLLGEGAAKYGADNWRSIPAQDHLDHAMRHILRVMSGEAPWTELLNAICRCAFAAEVMRVEAARRAADAVPHDMQRPHEGPSIWREGPPPTNGPGPLILWRQGERCFEFDGVKYPVNVPLSPEQEASLLASSVAIGRERAGE